MNATHNTRNYLVCLLLNSDNSPTDTLNGIIWAARTNVTQADMSRFVKRVKSGMSDKQINAAGRNYSTVRNSDICLYPVDTNPIRRNPADNWQNRTNPTIPATRTNTPKTGNKAKTRMHVNGHLTSAFLDTCKSGR